MKAENEEGQRQRIRDKGRTEKMSLEEPITTALS